MNKRDINKEPKDSLERLLSKERYDREIDYLAQQVELGWIWEYRYWIAFGTAVFVCFLIAILL